MMNWLLLLILCKKFISKRAEFSKDHIGSLGVANEFIVDIDTTQSLTINCSQPIFVALDESTLVINRDTRLFVTITLLEAVHASISRALKIDVAIDDRCVARGEVEHLIVHDPFVGLHATRVAMHHGEGITIRSPRAFEDDEDRALVGFFTICTIIFFLDLFDGAADSFDTREHGPRLEFEGECRRVFVELAEEVELFSRRESVVDSLFASSSGGRRFGVVVAGSSTSKVFFTFIVGIAMELANILPHFNRFLNKNPFPSSTRMFFFSRG